MRAIFTKATMNMASLSRTLVPQGQDAPRHQPFYNFDPAEASWILNTTSRTDAAQEQQPPITNIALYSWNIDFMLPFAEARMEAALSHLGRLTAAPSATTATIIFLQECVKSDLVTIASTPWVRDRFHLTDLTPENWATNYGTTMLIDARLPITAAFRVHYPKTRMDRDAAFVDVSLGPEKKTIRLCNSHLESLAFDPPLRPSQMKLIGHYLHEPNVHAGLAAGDFNAIQPFDRTLHVDNKLKDAYLELGGKEDAEEGFTWGQQAAKSLREQFGCSRMDKVYFRGGVRLLRFERFGRDILIEGEEAGKQIVELGFDKPWVTDHFGVVAEVQVASESEG